MKKTLVLVVDRDDDFGVKGKVNTPVIGVQNCLDAATAFGIADPEDSDLNALYAAVSVCLEIQEDGHDADVALICGDEQVGHKSDLALVSQLEEVLDKVDPDSVVLVGDGAEDEYIYPIVSSRAHVDSVRKVYVKQAPGLEGSLYILTRMLSDPGKRKRFLVPLGLILIVFSLFFLVPSFMVYLSEHNIETISSMSGSMVVFFLGLLLVLYGYSVGDKLTDMKKYIMSNLVGRSTRIIFITISLTVIAVSAIWLFYEISDMYLRGIIQTALYVLSSMVWPVILAMVVYIIGVMIEDFQGSKVIKLSNIFGCLSLTSIGLVALGILDLIGSYASAQNDPSFSIIEIVAGVALSILINFIKDRLKSIQPEAVADEVL